ncbi:MAG: GNAT family acetyltransferase [Rhodospirillales bacterium]|nr:GNAT family acetyltransferase [Rhodospirillales bacterium]
MRRIATYKRGGDGIAFAIRPICDGDEETVAELWRACGLVRSWNDPLGDIGRARANASSEIFVAVAQDSGGIAGSIMVGNDGHRGWVYYVAVTPEHRLRGLGERLIRHAEAWLRRLGAPRVNLTIREENAAARLFYEGLGYAIEKRIVMSRWTDEGG